MKKMILIVVCLLGVGDISMAANTTQDDINSAAYDVAQKIERKANIEKTI